MTELQICHCTYTLCNANFASTLVHLIAYFAVAMNTRETNLMISQIKVGSWILLSAGSVLAQPFGQSHLHCIQYL